MMLLAAMFAAMLASPPAGPDLAAYVQQTPRCAAEVERCFGVHLHLVVTGGVAVQTVEWVTSQVAEANARFATIDVNFEVVAAETLPASDLEIDDRGERDALGDPHFSRGVAHVFVVGRLADVDVAGSEIRGVHWRFRQDRARRWVILSKIAGALTLAHELGHFFGLPHSSYDESLMNKTPRVAWLTGELSFAEPEFARMRRHRDRMLREGMLTDRAAPKSQGKPPG
ncbi:matrixin family metalloprotease [Nannocystis bainbridge]|uniref:Matrixin family metalloprotease n=1 Tax=Nannocystis bainbridge TaxID=2995303 RepID=A0ABT5EA35_9BACT|nr:matrixin family metalloprotease [Nannocystis bainbridge]MDC0722308.1 matrixin family metalloprotease [Nannocystis bainbridge]